MKQPFLAWWQLLRIGNVFTAASNVIAGFLIVQGGWQPVGPLLVLIAASTLLYAAGMVLNDVFDAERDATERPERPIPSGRVSRRSAYLFGWILLILGILCGWWASWLTGTARPGIVATLLALAVVGYDAGLKNTPLGPWTMGGCRLLNILLGASIATQPYELPVLVYVTLVTLYTIGLTYFARSENEDHATINHRIGQCFIVAAVGGLFALLILQPVGPHDENSVAKVDYSKYYVRGA
ncbi:MAG: UbiA family prenyltransferase, partial [Planctomycetes bacterium]|nr:UbiA family prenyltransferase [Planctomycetota bacterium]